MESAGDIIKNVGRGRDAISKLIEQALTLEFEDAKAAGALGFMARALVQATMPHSKPKECFFERTNGAFTLTMMAPPKVGTSLRFRTQAVDGLAHHRGCPYEIPRANPWNLAERLYEAARHGPDRRSLGIHHQAPSSVSPTIR